VHPPPAGASLDQWLCGDHRIVEPRAGREHARPSACVRATRGKAFVGQSPVGSDFIATIDKLHAELAERDAVIKHLKTEHAAQSTAFEELAAIRSREQQSSALRQEEVRAVAEMLATEIQALKERYRCSTESIAAREA